MMKKKYLLYIIVSLFFLIISIRLFFICFINHYNYTKLLTEKTYITVNGGSAPRGRIIDSLGNVLVDNKGIKNIYYNKIKGITKNEELEIAKKLANIINVSMATEDELKQYWLLLNDNGKSLITDEEYELLEQRKLSTKDIKELKLERIPVEEINSFTDEDKRVAHIYYLMNNGYSYQKKLLVKNATEEECAIVSEDAISGVTVEMAWERNYLYGNTLRSILGNIGYIPQEEKDDYLSQGYELTDIVGLSYLEKEYEEYLKGTKAVYKVNKDNTLSLIKEAEKGNDLILSIDINIQMEIEKALQDKILGGKKSSNTEYYNESYALVGNPLTGSIFALSGMRLNEDQTFSDVSTNLITSSFTIGSAVKGATIGVGYKYDLIERNKYITDGCVKLYFVPQKCSFKRLGRINDITALAYSSNYYQFLIAIKLTGNNYRNNMKINATNEHFQIYRDMLKSYGLGALTQIDLPGEKTGIEGTNIADDLLLNLTIGQYDTYTPVEVLQYINSVASGQRMKLYLMEKIVNNEEVLLENKPIVLNNVDVNADDLERIRTGMNKVLLEGTGKGYVDAKLNPVGKTGTSQTFYEGHKTNSNTFAGYFPKDNPQYSLVVITPNVHNKEGKNDIYYYASRKITRQITDFLAQYPN